MKLEDFQKLREQVAEMKERCDAFAQTDAIHEASLVLIADEAKGILRRVGMLEREGARRRDENVEMQTAVTTTLDWLDRIKGTVPRKGRA